MPSVDARRIASSTVWETGAFEKSGFHKIVAADFPTQRCSPGKFRQAAMAHESPYTDDGVVAPIIAVGSLQERQTRCVTRAVDAGGELLDAREQVITVVGTDRWRAFFDLAADANAPVNLRCFLRLDGKALCETWLYQYLA
jgi:glucan biosynthesis protein